MQAHLRDQHTLSAGGFLDSYTDMIMGSQDRDLPCRQDTAGDEFIPIV